MNIDQYFQNGIINFIIRIFYILLKLQMDKQQRPIMHVETNRLGNSHPIEAALRVQESTIQQDATGSPNSGFRKSLNLRRRQSLNTSNSRQQEGSKNYRQSNRSEGEQKGSRHVANRTYQELEKQRLLQQYTTQQHLQHFQNQIIKDNAAGSTQKTPTRKPNEKYLQTQDVLTEARQSRQGEVMVDSRYKVSSPYKVNHQQMRRTGNAPYTPIEDYGQTSNTFDDMRSIDAYKAKISSNIRNNKDAGPTAELARNSVPTPSRTKDSRGKYVGEKLNQLITATMGDQKRLTTNPSEAGVTPSKNMENYQLSPQEQMFHDSRTFSPQSVNEKGQGGFLPVIEKQGGLFGQNHILQNQSRLANSPTPIPESTQGNWPDRSSGSRLLMATGATPQNVLYTLQQHANAERRIHPQNNHHQSTYDNRAQEIQQKQMIAMAQAKQAQMQLMGTPNKRHERNNTNAFTPNGGGKPRINDRQMEDLNETLQRLAREKLSNGSNVNKFGTTVHNDKIQRRLKINQRMTEKNVQLLAMEQLKIAEEQGGFSPVKKQKVNKKKSQAAERQDIIKQKLEHQQRNALLMGGDLISTRLQGVGKQSKPPLSNSPDKKTKLLDGVQSHQPGIDRKTLEFQNQNVVIEQKKVYKIQIDQIKLNSQDNKDFKTQQSPSFNEAPLVTSQSQISQYPMTHIYDETPNQRKQNIQVGIEQYKHNTTGNNSPTTQPNTNGGRQENNIHQRVFIKTHQAAIPGLQNSHENDSQSALRQSQQSVTGQTPTKNKHQSHQSVQVMRNKLTLAVPMQFSSVIEDVELEQQVSPSPNNKKARQRERGDFASVRAESRNQADMRINLMVQPSQGGSSSALSSQQMFKGIGETESLQNLHTAQNQTQQASAFRNSYLMMQPGTIGKRDSRAPSPQDAGYLTNQTNAGAKPNSFTLQQPQQNVHHQSVVNFKDGGDNDNKVSMLDFGQIAIQDNQSQQNLQQFSSNHHMQAQNMSQQDDRNLRLNLIKVTSPIDTESAAPINPNHLQIDINQQIRRDGSKSHMRNEFTTEPPIKHRGASSSTRQSHTNLHKNEGSQSSQQHFGGGFRRQQQPNSTSRRVSKLNTAGVNQLELPNIAKQRDRAVMNVQSRESRNFEQQRLTRKESSIQDLNAAAHVGNQNGALTGRSKLPPKSPNTLTNSPHKKDKTPPGKGGHGTVRHNHSKGKRVSNFLNKVPSEKSIDNGYVSSDAPESVHCLKLGIRVPKEYTSFAKSYCQHKNYKKVPKAFRHMYTPRIFRKSSGSFVWSQRMFLSHECASSEYRRMMPILILNLDGAVGYWEKNVYVLRKGVIDSLITLSYDFRLIAVSSQRQKKVWKIIYALMNMSAGPSDGNNNQMRHLVFDAVYQLCTQNEDHKDKSFVKNIDEVHFDLTQILLDMQFKQHLKKEVLDEDQKVLSKKIVTRLDSTYKTFWETDNYRPYKKILIFTTEKYLEKSTCYSFDYNYLFQAQKFIHEDDKKAPIVLQMPHLRVNPRLAFDSINQLIFTLQYLAHSNNLSQLENQIHQNGSVFQNPNYTGYELCKKLLSGKWKALERKMRTQANVRGLRIFDGKQDPFVDLDAIDFSKAYKVLKQYFKRPGETERISDWLKIKKYYLRLKPAKNRDLSPEKIKQNLKVTFNESPEIHHREEKDKGSRANATTHDSSKSDRISNVKNNQYVSEEAKNLYNGLMIRNYKIQQEINAFARHIRIQNQRKHDAKKQMQLEEQKEEELGSPIIIFDGDKEMMAERKSILRSSMKKSSILKPRREVKKPEEPKAQKKEKEYAFKFRVLKVKTGDAIWEYADIDFSKHNLINLRSKPLFNYAQIYTKGGIDDNSNGYPQQTSTPTPTLDAQSIQQLQSYIASHTYSHISHSDQLDPRNLLTDMLSKRQTKISYGTTQEMHLKNNLNQLENGEKQYQEQHKIITENEKAEKHEAQKQADDNRIIPVTTHRAFNKDKLTTQEYIDQL